MDEPINLLKDKIFFSSTFRDFKDARSKILLNFQNMEISVEAMENFNATATSPVQESKKRLEDSQIYLLVVGEMYGTVDPETGLSITEIEYDHALSLLNIGKIKQIWIFKPTSEYIPKSEHMDTDKEKMKKLKSFREKVCGNHTPRYYDNLDDLRSEINLQCGVSFKEVLIPLLEKAGVSAKGIRQSGIYETNEVRFPHEKKQLSLDLSEIKQLESQITEMNKIFRAIGKEEVKSEKLDVKSVTIFGNYYYTQQEFEKAKEMYDLILKYYPDDPRALNNKGCSLRAEFERDKARKLFEQASELEPNYNDPKVNLGGILCELNRAEEGLAILNQVYQIEKDSPDFSLLLNLGFAYSKLKNYKTAHVFYEKAEELDSTQTQILINIAILFQGEKNYVKAIEYADKILKIDKNHPHALSTKGSCFLNQGYYANGIHYLERSLKYDPKELTTLVNLALAYRRVHEDSKINSWYADWVEMYASMALSVNKDYPAALAHIGWCYNRCHRYKEATSFVEKALLKNPKNVGILMDKADTLLNLGKKEEALDILNEIIRNDKPENDLEILSLKYNLLIEMKKQLEADEFIKEIENELTPEQLKWVKTQRKDFGRIIQP